MMKGSSDVLKNIISITFQSKSDHIKHTNTQYKNIPDEAQAGRTISICEDFAHIDKYIHLLIDLMIERFVFRIEIKLQGKGK